MGTKVRLIPRDPAPNTMTGSWAEAWVEVVEEREDGWVALPMTWTDRTMKPLFFPRFAWEVKKDG